MGHFEYRLNWPFWRSKKVVQVVQIGGGGIWTKSKRTATFFRETFPKIQHHDQQIRNLQPESDTDKQNQGGKKDAVQWSRAWGDYSRTNWKSTCCTAYRVDDAEKREGCPPERRENQEQKALKVEAAMERMRCEEALEKKDKIYNCLSLLHYCLDCVRVPFFLFS